MIKRLICKVTGHVEESAGSCPFTGQTYNHCTRCDAMIPLQYMD
jgi:hypothetical protein